MRRLWILLGAVALLLCPALPSQAQDGGGWLPELNPITVENAHRIAFLGTLEYGSEIRAVAFNHTSSILAIGGAGHTISMWNLETGERAGVLYVNNDTVLSLAFSPNDVYLAVGMTHYSAGGAAGIAIWNLETDEMVAELSSSYGPSDPVLEVLFSLDGRLLAAIKAGAIGHILLWDMQTIEDANSENEIIDFTEGFVSTMTFTDDDSLLATTFSHKTGRRIIQSWRVTEGLVLPQLAGVLVSAFSADGTQALVVDETIIHLVDVETGNEVLDFPNYTASTNVTFGPDGTMLVATNENAVHLIERTNGNVLATLQGPIDDTIDTTVEISSNRMLIATASFDGTIRLWGVPTQE